MSAIGTFNGSEIFQLPTSPAPKAIEFTTNNTVAVSTSPFSGSQQVQNWGTSWLEASVTMPPMTHAQAQAWIAFLMQLQGQAGTFQLGDPLAKTPRGSASGTPLTLGTQSGYKLATKGWTASATGVLLAGDCIQVGYRLYRCTKSSVDADALGNATFDVWPQIREQPTDGTALTLTNTKGLWRMTSNQLKWSSSEMKTYGVVFSCREAI